MPEDEKTIWQSGQSDNSQPDAPEDVLSAQVPSSLLPAVLLRLGLAPEQNFSELTIDELAARLKSDDWSVRAAAVHALGRWKSTAPVELLASMLDDEDEAVRAAAVHALGESGAHTPLHYLMAALHDPDWHVRETALYALGKQGARVPSEVLGAALYDADSAVREAAQLTLRWHEADAGAPAMYGKLWEQTMMQYNGHDRGQAGDKDGRASFEYVPYDAGYGAITSSAYAARPYMPGEPAQAYAQPPEQGAYQLQEYAPREQAGEGREKQAARYAYGEESPLRAEKVTSFAPPRKSHKKWWIMLIVASAIIFFIMGASISLFVTSSRVSPMAGLVSQSGSASSVQKGGPVSSYPYPEEFVFWFQKDVASALHLTPDQVRAQLLAGQSMTSIAAAQGVTPLQLQNIESEAYQTMLSNEVKAGDLSPQVADKLVQQFQRNPGLTDKLTVAMFLMKDGNPQPPPIPGN